ncbi:GntR family transcriptional regulator [Methylobacterium sp. E-065]|uniref:GntR family transcriptional regulator n=1 Tax=Methylobacterium sp. E-065 TaxID=2836583 RepID=UPI001FB87275|nr:GntR family transcriptional regulator [Methylobacterium sp. E-065]MCJ2022467.1 GntR family transcriptional regulator [Methylobacterium sp. E-065]
MDASVDDIIVIQEVSLGEQVRRKLQMDIISGEIPPGTILSGPALAQHLGISSSPVREALLQLAADGLLEVRRNRGFVVVTPTVEDLRNTFQVRVRLETMAIEQLVQIGLPDPAPLTAIADEIAAAVRKGDVPVYMAADRAFHEALLDAAGNPVLTRIALKLRDTMRLYGIRSENGSARQAASVEEHYAMIELAKNKGSMQEAGELMTRHILEWEPLFVAALDRVHKQKRRWALT